jgi:hypothetical protein
MHNCNAIQAILVDLIFDDADSQESARLRAGLKSCASCCAEYDALTETLRVVDRSLQLRRPAEGFWPAYHARLDQRIKEFHYLQSRARQSAREPGHQRKIPQVFFASLRVPVPVAAAFVLLFVFATLLAFRAPQPLVVASPAPPPTVETRTVTVPVIQEKVITRLVYVGRKRAKSRGAELKADAASSLAGFRPTDEVKLTVIRGGYRDEQ